MHKTPSLSENETLIEYFSSQTVHAAREKKEFRRRLVIIVLAGLKLLTVAYFGLGDLLESGNAAASVPHFEAVAPFVQ